MTRAIIQRELSQRNEVYKIQTLDNAAEYGARKSVQSYILGDHRTKVIYITKAAKRDCEAGKSCEIMTNVSEPSLKDAYMGFMLAPSSAKNHNHIAESMSTLKCVIYIEMTGTS